MKNIKIIPIIVFTFLLAWFVPWAYHLATEKPERFPFAYYSSIINDFGIRESDGEKSILTDSKGTSFTQLEFDSILPMMYYRQLASQGQLPDSLHGRAIDQKVIATYNFYFRYRPSDQFKPAIRLYPLFESIPKRVDLEMPGDVFRLTNEISFIDPVINTINESKSKVFNDVLKKRGFQGPARLVAGTPTTRKAYDNGYFIIDSTGALFHLKMVNGKPFIKKVETASEIKPQWIVTTEYPSKLFYGFLFTEDNRLFSIGTNGYELKEVSMPVFNQESDNLLIMGNIFYWNVQVNRKEAQEVWALDAKTLEVVDRIAFSAQSVDNPCYKWIFPFELTCTSRLNAYVFPFIKFDGVNYMMLSAVLVLLFVWITRKSGKKLNLFEVVWIFLTGIYGLVSILLFGKTRRITRIKQS